MARRSEAETLAEDRTRILAILESPEGLARPASARKCALVMGLSVEMSLDFLRGLPVESAFAAAMQTEGPIGIGAAMGGPVAGDAKTRRLAEIKQAGAAHSLAKGYISPEKAAARGVKVSV
ncbi:hypothetical protein [Methylocystis parvus]|uniref:hypothetical protein n=1 Tax=Methylocystis parvus TaxID=134 RepID=UPI003C784DB0